MPDITMCATTTCKARDRCYRHTATPSVYRQPCDDFSRGREVDDCPAYRPNREVAHDR
jgi:hypothetical protein